MKIFLAHLVGKLAYLFDLPSALNHHPSFLFYSGLLPSEHPAVLHIDTAGPSLVGAVGSMHCGEVQLVKTELGSECILLCVTVEF